MSVPDDYKVDFDAEQLPVWFIPEESTIAYHLYPRCGHIDQRGDYELSKQLITYKRGDYNSIDDFTDQIRSDRHMCDHCWKKFRNESIEYAVNNDEPVL